MNKTNLSRRAWLQLGTSAATIALTGPLFHSRSNGARAKVDLTIRLNSNENQFGPSDTVLKTILEECRLSNLYTWNGRAQLRAKIAAKEGVAEDHILLGAGSTELLQLTGMTFAPTHQKFISSYPTFPILMDQGMKFQARWTKVPLTEKYAHDLDGLRAAAAKGDALIYLCNPNNPTGTYASLAQIKELAADLSPNQILFVDEAYLEFTDPTLTDSTRQLIGSQANVIVARTFSKIHGLAGLRIGYIMAQPALIEKIKKYQVGFGLDIPRVSLVAAGAALDDRAFLTECRNLHQMEKERLYEAFNDWSVSFVPSQTSFIYFETKSFQPKLVDELKRRHILIRDYPDQAGRARVSIGTPEQTNRFVEACEQLVK